MVIEYNKLVRNKIPDIIKADSQVPVTKILSQQEYKKALLEKLVEEANEVLESNGSVEELADITQVLIDIQKELGVSAEDIEWMRKDKEAKRGGFDQKIFLERVEIDD